MKFILVLLVLIMSACSTVAQKKELPVEKRVEKKKKVEKIVEEPLTIQTLTGKVTYVEIAVNLPNSQILLDCTDSHNKKISYSFMVQDGIAKGYNKNINII